MTFVKAHAYGNDFLFVSSSEVSGADLPVLARAVCDRHRGIGADGLMVFEAEASPVRMRLLNADGSRSEVSGNGVRCLAAWLADRDGLGPGATVEIATDAGVKRLELLARDGPRVTFRASMGQPTDVRRLDLTVGGRAVDVVTLRVGNPQCVVLGDVTEARLHTVAAPLAVHPHFPEGTNVELAEVARPDLVRILIWERGVGPTAASGTGACAAAVAAMRYGSALRDVQVTSPGGTQRVEWHDDGLYLTGWAEIIADAEWRARASHA